MQPQQLSLKDIHLPETINWWPPAMGWWISAVLMLLLVAFIIWMYKRITRKTALKTAKKILLSIKQDTSLNDRDKLSALSNLIRRVSVSLSPREETASLTGQAWLDYLNSTVKGTPFSSDAGHIFANAQYQKSLPQGFDIYQLTTLCEQWLLVQKEYKK